MRVEMDVDGRAITILECRPPWREDFGPEWTRQEIARMRYTKSTGVWTLCWPDRHSKFHRYEDLDPTPTIDRLLAEIDADPRCIFWGLRDGRLVAPRRSAASPGRPAKSIAKAKADVPRRPGLYAVHGEAAVWQEFGLGEPTDARPLSVGKAERSLASRDVYTQFSTGKTGSFTLRRSLAGLLADALSSVGLAKTEHGQLLAG